MWTKYRLIHSYTIEAGYNMCSTLAKNFFQEANLPKNMEQFLRFSPTSDNSSNNFIQRPMLPQNIGQLCKNLQLDYHLATYYFTQRDYELVGRELAGSLLDLIDRNPLSRLFTSPLQTLRVNSFDPDCKDLLSL